MKKLLFPAIVGVLFLTGCSASNPENVAFDTCKQSIEGKLGADSYDWSDVSTSDMGKALFDSGIKDDYDSSDATFYTVGELLTKSDDTESRHSVICKAKIVDGNGELVDEPTITD